MQKSCWSALGISHKYGVISVEQNRSNLFSTLKIEAVIKHKEKAPQTILGGAFALKED